MVDREAIRDQVRLSTVIEDTNVSDAEINSIINEGVNWVDGYYPYPVTIASLDQDTDAPAWDASFHWILVDFTASKLMEREEYFDVAESLFGKALYGARQMIRFYTGGRT